MSIVEGGEEVNMLRHDDVPADVDAAIDCRCAKESKVFVNDWVGEKFLAVMSAEGQEVEKWIGVNSIQT